MTRTLKTLHGWLGVLILPWIVLAGFTGLFENHGLAMLRVLPGARFTAALLADLPDAPLDLAGAEALADRLLPAPRLPLTAAPLMGRPGFEGLTRQGALQIDAATGAYLVIGPYASTLYDAQGTRLAT